MTAYKILLFAGLGLFACARNAPPPKTAEEEPAPAASRARLPACEPHPFNVGLCVLELDPDDAFSNENPTREGVIGHIGGARPECFAGTNWSQAIPIVWNRELPARVPEGTLWLRIDGEGQPSIVVGVAAPGVESLGIAVGDRASIHWPISVGGEVGTGTAELHVQGRGRVQLALNALEPNGLGFGSAACARSGSCAGEEHVLKSSEGLRAAVGHTATDGRTHFTAAEAITRGPSFIATHEGYTGPSGCQGQKRASLAAFVRPE